MLVTDVSASEGQPPAARVADPVLRIWPDQNPGLKDLLESSQTKLPVQYLLTKFQLVIIINIKDNYFDSYVEKQKNMAFKLWGIRTLFFEGWIRLNFSKVGSA